MLGMPFILQAGQGRQSLGGSRSSFLLNGQGFASECRLIQEQVPGGEHPNIGWHHIAGGQPGYCDAMAELCLRKNRRTFAAI